MLVNTLMQLVSTVLQSLLADSPTDASQRVTLTTFTVRTNDDFSTIKPRLHDDNRLSHRLYSRFDNRLYRVNGV